MILGSYSISNILIMCKDPEKKENFNQYIWMVVLSSIMWIAALILLVYYWTSLELWAKLFGITGLLFNGAGPIFTLLVIYLGIKDSVDEINSNLLPTEALKSSITQPKIDSPPL